MSAPYFGQCLCGAIRYRLTQEPLTYYACHCTDCQRRSGTAFALSLWVRREAVDVLQGEPTHYPVTMPDGRKKHAMRCARCGIQLWGEPGRHPGLAIIQPGTLDQPTGLVPIAHLWTRSAQPWAPIAGSVKCYETQPDDFTDLMRLWQKA